VRALFFSAVAEHPKIALPLMNQAKTALDPFDRYLRQAITTARERQVRYKLPWARVEEMRERVLEPLDTRLRIPREPPGWRLVNWPMDREPDLEQVIMVVNRSVLVRVTSCARQPEGYVLQLDKEILPDDQMFWCGVSCQIKRLEAGHAPQELEDREGRRFAVVHAELLDDQHAFVVHVRGRPADGPLRIEGRTVEAERLPDFEGLVWVYEGEWRLRAEGCFLRGTDLPAAGSELRADNGLRFRVRDKGRPTREGLWIQLLPPEEIDDSEFIDPRAAFCEAEIDEVWTQHRHDKNAVIKVVRVDRDRYQLRVRRMPPRDVKFLYLPVDVRKLELQRRALRQLREAPLQHQRGLLRLCEEPEKVRWPRVEDRWPEHWYFLKDLERSGTDEQRRFVARALGNPDVPDLVLLEGPPGSGKTTAICELIRQCVERGERVLLCASTNVAIDNVLERLVGDPAIDAVRIGRLERVDDNVQRCQIDERVEALVASLREAPHFASLGDEELRDMAERTVIMAANLTCGTTMGIVSHPLFQDRDRDLKPWERPITTMPHWDVLIVDEASKTTIQEFMVPAMMARRHVIVGDVRQLPPFTDRDDLLANLRSLVDENERPVFPPEHQRARLLWFRLARQRLRRVSGARWLLVEPGAVIDALARELEAIDKPPVCAARVTVRSSGARAKRVVEVTVDEAQRGDPRALWLAAADWVLVPSELLPEVEGHLPANLLLAEDVVDRDPKLSEGSALLFRSEAWQERAGALDRSIRERGQEVSTFAELAKHERAWLERHDWAGEVVWRLTRLHELRRSKRERERERLDDDIYELLPDAVDISDYINDIEDIGLPSILEVVQEGIGREVKRPSGLTSGLGARPEVLKARFASLSFQHRMHTEISAFSRELIYEGKALRDANTIAHRDEPLSWDFAPELKARRVWLDVRGRESHGANPDEVAVVENLVRKFLSWAKRKGRPRRERSERWELACLCFYLKQEQALRDMLQRVTGIEREYRFTLEEVEIVCGVVDRFQGREADLVLLSTRNTGRTGFLDSPNRLNVSVTRARQQLVIVGNADYFGRCDVPELEELVKRTRRCDGRPWRAPGRRA